MLLKCLVLKKEDNYQRSNMDDIKDPEPSQIINQLDDCHLIDVDDNEDTCDLPRMLIVTGVPDSVFEEDAAKDGFESLFRNVESTAEIFYLKCFRRARVVFRSPISATRARIHLHEKEISGSVIKCYFAQPEESERSSTSASFLEPPKPDKQFLISPPCSPPVGWESVNEKEPVINYDLIAAITNLAPGEAHELHAPTEFIPGIVVHICEDPEGFKSRPQILQTRCPNAM